MLLDYTLDTQNPLQINRKLFIGDLGRQLEMEHGVNHFHPYSFLDNGVITLNGSEDFPIKV